MEAKNKSNEELGESITYKEQHFLDLSAIAQSLFPELDKAIRDYNKRFERMRAGIGILNTNKEKTVSCNGCGKKIKKEQQRTSVITGKPVCNTCYEGGKF
jgi:hypothetical protein